ncbi:MAG: hypothetical protein A3B96_01095 [Candidatus Spechtbacteria bacterium RIFCSPHIGHO2_02_FULL_43_15b]|uniref:Amidinotransferase n=1 Tax=Candidatus Spechtbacteria bacterium RIFCSPHIGHO2_01_FULL_43_30 TaxID=1802158 RepID=A0A1G2H4D2_9BACT|nr:MAG: hypothetical protein A2827_03495 [Candidatus Spechtbacteria bacterium RIFCSPHIGHO2_01_FULL_43_30]OGZ59010.1 MAG: hypothetical protein A3B96_01095 [Candidatus Spechtbacteria bacterium RIFCSPHIGHO2_02_FULL_43_15b]
MLENKRARRIRLLMCYPEYFKIPGRQNARMNVNRQPNKKLANAQWTALFNNYQRLGFQVHILEPNEYLHDLCFTANGALSQYNVKTGRNEAVLSNFLHPNRELEKLEYRKALKELGYLEENIFEIPESIKVEGQGDWISMAKNYLFGCGIRSYPEAAEHVKRLLQLEKEVIALRLLGDSFYHADTCVFSLRYKNAIIYYPGAFAGESVDKLRKLNEDKFEVSDSLANHLVCNSVYLGDIVFLNIDFSDYSAESFESSAYGRFLAKDGTDIRYKELLDHEKDYEAVLKFIWDRGYDIIPVYTSEFEKSGGGARCLTLFLD